MTEFKYALGEVVIISPITGDRMGAKGLVTAHITGIDGTRGYHVSTTSIYQPTEINRLMLAEYEIQKVEPGDD